MSLIKSNINKIVGSKIKKVRKENALTQQELADLLFSTQGEIQRIETGKRRIDIGRLVSFSKVLNRDIVYFLSDFTDNNNP
jgi:transcriptional regulator with XRE-family HTH domain